MEMEAVTQTDTAKDALPDSSRAGSQCSNEESPQGNGRAEEAMLAAATRVSHAAAVCRAAKNRRFCIRMQ